MTADNKEFDRLLMDSVDEALAKVFGENTAKSVVFYIDTNLAPADPSNYARSLEKLFGPGANVILEAIMNTLSKRVERPRTDSKDFGELVLMMKVSYKEFGTKDPVG